MSDRLSLGAQILLFAISERIWQKAYEQATCEATIYWQDVARSGYSSCDTLHSLLERESRRLRECLQELESKHLLEIRLLKSGHEVGINL